jgi:hypothetical protein
MRNHGLHPRLRTLTGYDGIQCEVLDLFSRLAADLSPENLTCDGELPRSQVNARLRGLQKKWKALESFVGRPVSEEEVWKHLQTQETELQAELDKLVELDTADGDAQSQINGTREVTEGVAYTVETCLAVSPYLAKTGVAGVRQAIKQLLEPLAFAAGKQVTFKVTIGPDKPLSDNKD